MQITQEFDFFVIGGGSGGLAAAKQAASQGAKVGLADFVKPSPLGTKWGLGGTCVNVGCIPKKLMHFAALAGELRKDQVEAGWINADIKGKHDWNRMTENYKNQLNNKEVKYYNKLAELEKSNIVKLIDKDGGVEFVKSKFILIAVGGRPSYPEDIPEIEKVITSDDLFWLPNNPGKTLVVGASYVALECGGFLNGLGCDSSIMVRSILLRGFDQEIAGKIEDYMVESGIKFIKEAIPINIEVIEHNRRLVTWKQKGVQHSDTFDTVLIATGRKSDTSKLNLERVGVKTNKNGKIICTIDDRTSVANIYAIGDCVEGRPELTPTAIKCGQLLANRLFGGQKKMMCYQFIPTTVFTPLEYGCIGYSEEEAINKFTQNEIIIYHSIFKPLEWNLLESHYAQACMIKLIVMVSTRRVIGLHYLGPNAGEVVQGYAVAIKLGATKEQFDATIGIHPTCSEEILTLTAVKGIDNPQKEGC